jgi:hypothetical protein
LSLRLYQRPPCTPVTRASSIRSVQTRVRFEAQASPESLQRLRRGRHWLKVWRHVTFQTALHFPASLGSPVVTRFTATMEALTSPPLSSAPTGISLLNRCTFPAFSPQPPSDSLTIFSETCLVIVSGRSRTWASHGLRRLATPKGRIGFNCLGRLLWDGRFASGGSPPRLTATQLPSATRAPCPRRTQSCTG